MEDPIASWPGPLPGPDIAVLRRRWLERCLRSECDIDPLILRARRLRHSRQLAAARSLEQELLPIF